MIGDAPIIDAVVHPYNLAPDNWATDVAEPSAKFLAAACYAASIEGFRLRPDAFIRDWQAEEMARIAFLESQTDLAVYHVVPMFSFKDGSCSFEKGLEVQKRWGNRFITYAGVDPLLGPQALDELDRQFELLGGPIGLKLYPNSWNSEGVFGWFMDDPEFAFPVFERAQRLGIKIIAIHKAIPLGPLPLEHYRIDDIDRAAAAFPDLQFEIVHGGMAFLEETAWQLARFPNVFVNLEVTTAYAAARPRAFTHALASMLAIGGDHALERICWGTGCVGFHPRPHIEAFWNDIQFSEDEMARFGIAQLDKAAKRKIFAGNYAAIAGLDLAARLAAITNDEFSRATDEFPKPYSTVGLDAYVD